MKMLTIGEVAELFAQLEPGVPASCFAGQARYYVRLRLVRPPRYRGTGRTAAALLGEHQICITYLLSTLTRLGIRAEQFRRLADYFDAIGVRRRGQDEYFGSLREVIRATKAGQRWFLSVKVKALSKGEGSVLSDVHGEFHDRPDAAPDEVGHWLAVIVLYCDRLLRPLLERLNEPGDADRQAEQRPGTVETELNEGGEGEATTPERPRRRTPSASA